MAHLTVFPTQAAVLELVLKAERSRKLVWTAGMVLKRAGLVTPWEELSHSDRKFVMESITAILKKLAAEGILQRRPLRQSIGFGGEIAFDYIRSGKNPTETLAPIREP